MVCAGTVFDVSQDVLRTRSLNINVEYFQDGTDEHRWLRSRFRSGREHFQWRAQRGQIQGHICRVLDSSNVWSSELVCRDLFYLFVELNDSGWSRPLFHTCLRRLLAGSPQLAPVVRLTDALIRAACADE